MAEPVGPLIDGKGYLYIDLSTVGELITGYVATIEQERTNKICKCEWIVHPDDTEKPEGERRMRRGETTLDCPVHTKEGFLIGFIRYVMTNDKPAIDVTSFTDSEPKFIPIQSGQYVPVDRKGSWLEIVEIPDGD